MATVIQTAKITVPAGGQATFAFFGELLYCKAANVPFQVQGHKTQNRFPLEAGAKVRITEAETQFLVINETATDLAATLLFGSGDYENDQFNGSVVVVGASVFVPKPVIELSGAQQLVAAADDTRVELHLKAGTGNTGVVWIGGESEKGIPLDAGDAYIVSGSAGVAVVGEAGDKLYSVEVKR